MNNRKGIRVMITREIAKNGLKGRKRISLLLILVLSCTFLFLVAALLLESSMSQTKRSQRQKLYGKWGAAYLGADAETSALLQAEPIVSDAAVSEILGSDSRAGTVGSFQPALAELGELHLVQGKYPVAPNEVLLESHVANALGLEEPIGTTLNLTIRNSPVRENLEQYLYDKVQEYRDKWDYYMESYSRRQVLDKEYVEDATLTLESRYCYFSESFDYATPEEIEENGLLYEQDLTYARAYVVCGVIDSYSAFWDIGTNPVANVFLSQAGAEEVKEAVRQTKLTDLADYGFPANVFCFSNDVGEELFGYLYGKYGENSAAFRRNNYAYPQVSGSMEEQLAQLVVEVIFAIAFCAVLQIFLTQMRQRARKIALLKSIGATSGQIFQVMLWEAAYLLLYSMPVGVLCGFGAGYGAILLLNRYGGMELSFCWDMHRVLWGIAIGCLALLAGMAIPVIRAVRVPLVGSISVRSRRPGRHSRRGRQRILTFRRVSKAHRRLNWKTSALTGAIAMVMALILFSCLYLGYASFGSYRAAVVEGNRPNYVLSAPHGYKSHDITVLKEQIAESLPGAELTSYQNINKVYLQYDNIGDSPLIQAYKELLPPERYGEFIGTEPSAREMMRGCQEDLSMVLGSIRTTLYAIETSGSLFEQLAGMVSDGRLEENSFIRGESVVLAIPMYREMGKAMSGQGKIPEKVTDKEMFSYVLAERGNYSLSYQKRDEGWYQKETSIRPGDKVQISRMEEVVMASKPPIRYITTEAEVAGIIYYTPDERPYPFFDGEDGYTILASSGFLTKFSPEALANPALVGADQQGGEGQFAFTLSQCPTMYGETHVNIYTEDGANAIESAASVIQAGKSYGMEFTNYNEENWSLYFSAWNTAVVLGMLGAVSLAIALMILWNIRLSSFEQERPRIGVLQALGVTNGELIWDQLFCGIRSGIVSLAAAHMVLAAALLLAQGTHWELYQYPWALHISLCAVYFLAVAAVSCGAYFRLRRYAPNENLVQKQ